MSNTEIVRRGYEAFARRDMGLYPEDLAADFTWHSRPDFPGKQTYSTDEMPAFWADLDEAFTDFSLVPTDFAEFGDRVLVTLRASTQLKGTEDRVEETAFHVWLLSDGKIREGWTYRDRSEARRAVGLRE